MKSGDSELIGLNSLTKYLRDQVVEVLALLKVDHAPHCRWDVLLRAQDLAQVKVYAPAQPIISINIPMYYACWWEIQLVWVPR
jgi:hypothetical protein